jgi:polyhydroxyalkanoate synthesis regulator phasin
MLDMIRKGILAGLGFAYITKEKVMEATRELVEKGKLSRDEAETLANELVDEGSRQRLEIEAKIEELIRRGFDQLDIGSKKAFVDLEQRLGNVEKRLHMVEDRLGAETETGEPLEQ